MHTALAILAHALRMLIFETATTVRVIMPALIMVMGSAVVAVVLAPEAVVAFQTTPDEVTLPGPNVILILLALGVVALLGYALLAILWHRHVLMSGTNGDAAHFPSTSVFLSYLGRAIMVALMQILASIPITLAMGLLGTLLVPAVGNLALLAVGVLGGLAFVWIALRISLVLPAAAVANPMTLRESWEATAPLSSTIWGVAALLAGLNMCILGVTSAILPDQGGIVLIVQTAVYLIEGIVFISVLTTLYGNLVEGRSLG